MFVVESIFKSKLQAEFLEQFLKSHHHGCILHPIDAKRLVIVILQKKSINNRNTKDKGLHFFFPQQ